MSDLDTLFERLRSRRWEVRKSAAQAMVKAGAPAPGTLPRRYPDENADLRLICRQGPRLDGKPGQRSPRSSAPWQTRMPDVRKAAAEALAKLGGAAAVAPLIVALMDEDWSVREAVAEALGSIGDPGAIAPLIGLLKDSYLDVREAGAECAGPHRPARGIQPHYCAQ